MDICYLRSLLGFVGSKCRLEMDSRRSKIIMELLDSVKYKGSILSLNEVISGQWRNYIKKKKIMESRFRNLIMRTKKRELSQFGLRVVYHSRHDPDGVSYAAKVFIDTLRYLKRVPEDNPLIMSKGFAIKPDLSLPKNTYVFEIYGTED